ncbi:type I restriction enzyme HsdR N-terminal domain-containing protein [Thermodesulfobacteriota bacterium]
MKEKQGHHLILGELIDFITGETLEDTHDERYRQKIARLLVKHKGYDKTDIKPRCDLIASAGEKQAIVKIDFSVNLSGKICMIIKYGPGSLVTRHRPALAASRLLAPYQIPVVVVTNGEDADIIEGSSGKLLSKGLDSIPSKPQLINRIANEQFGPITGKQAEWESRIFYAFEVDGSCPCDDTVCRL